MKRTGSHATWARGRDRYSGLALLRNAIARQPDWRPAWRDAEPKPAYDVVVIGGGGHGLATAYYLAKVHGLSRVAVLEKGWIGGGNTGRNTTVVRSNYFFPESAAFYDFALTQFEGLSLELNFNIMFSQHGVINLIQSRHEQERALRLANALTLTGIDCELLTEAQVRREIPLLAARQGDRFPLMGGIVQRRAGTIRHDAVTWGYARAADRLGVDIIQNCEVTGFRRQGSRITAVETSRGEIGCGAAALCVAGHSTEVARKAGVELPITSYALQAFVTEPVKPVLHRTVVANSTGVYVSQSEKGELVVGQGLDRYPSYAQRGNIPVMEDTVAALVDIFPAFSRLRIMRQWAGVVDVTHDSSPIIGKTPIANLYVNCGFGTGGFKAIPAGGITLAETIANDRPHPLAAPFGLDRFESGRMIDEHAAAGIPH